MFCMKRQPAGQGVASATKEQIRLLQENCGDIFEIEVNGSRDGDINHYHQVSPRFYLRMLFGALRKNRPVSVVHVHFLPETLEGSIHLPGPVMKVFCKYVIDFYRRSDHAVVVNPIFTEPLQAYGLKEERIHYIPNFVSRERFYKLPDGERNKDRKKYGLPNEAFVVLGVGQVQTRKGVLDFLESAKQCPDMQFVWAGGFSFGTITDGYHELKERVENPPANVKFLGIVDRDELNAVYNMADVLFLPSYNELFPMSILEACNINLPLVLRNLPLYENILFGKYMHGESAEDFSALLRALQEDPELASEASQKSAEIAAFYSKEHVSDCWRKFYPEIYDEKKQS